MSKRNKYHAIKTTVCGVRFDSRSEASRYSFLKQSEAEGRIKNLILQPRFVVQPGFGPVGKRIRAIEYVADFQYTDHLGRLIVEDVKGKQTDTYKIKKKMFLFKYGNAHVLREVTCGVAIDICPIYATIPA